MVLRSGPVAVDSEPVRDQVGRTERIQATSGAMAITDIPQINSPRKVLSLNSSSVFANIGAPSVENGLPINARFLLDWS
ncbi:hypothetical protein CH260_08400 [Rhodococcus sp. 05-2256-B2]|nr:hypothetical protein ACG96_11610 [Rhodococcus fascians]KQU33370.1 hypothetical protein ASH04_05685 [Rhodococcus sp. Leaf233]OZD77243.1 hypothetical protein CH258_27155 [Rhodococcus sp. 05-2256-B4]OZD88362.1 hypothetical protein CH257_22950 [Rhodococcus sp. 05-2256-B3]OZD98495.1 hypothetical protein CH260_08400 [Rhodococcus sp. 05-2256-B2]OZE05298.1 hypothetical protein CH285_06325 [Rhodococcus sp. 05-2256-B1]